MKLATVLATILLAGTLVQAADAENSSTTTVDHSKNPITGSKKTKKVTKMKAKNASGDQSEAQVTETTIVKTNGTVEKKVEVKADATATQKKH
jgi:hypothetical protein